MVTEVRVYNPATPVPPRPSRTRPTCDDRPNATPLGRSATRRGRLALPDPPPCGGSSSSSAPRAQRPRRSGWSAPPGRTSTSPHGPARWRRRTGTASACGATRSTTPGACLPGARTGAVRQPGRDRHRATSTTRSPEPIVDRLPRPAGRHAGRRHRRLLRSRGPHRRRRDLHVRRLAARARTSTRAAPTRPSRSRWACTARWSSGRRRPACTIRPGLRRRPRSSTRRASTSSLLQRDRPRPPPRGGDGRHYDFNKLHNRYFTINGREFPDTIQDNGVSWLPNQPYGALVRVQPLRPDEPPAGAGPHGQRGRAQPPVPPARQPPAADRAGRAAAAQPGRPDASSEHFGETIASGQTDGLPLQVDRPGRLGRDHEADPVAGPDLPEPHVQGQPDLVQRQRVPRDQGDAADRSRLVERLRRVVLPLAQPRAERVHELRRGLRRHGDAAAGRPARRLHRRTRPRRRSRPAAARSGRVVLEPRRDDGTYYQVNSTTTGARSRPTGTAASPASHGATNLKVTYTGNDMGLVRRRTSTPWRCPGRRARSPALDVLGSGNEREHEVRERNGSAKSGNMYSYGSPAARRGHSAASGAAPSTRPSAVCSRTRRAGRLRRWRSVTPASSGAMEAVEATLAIASTSSSTNATSLTTGTWNDVNSLDFSSPVTRGTGWLAERKRGPEPDGQELHDHRPQHPEQGDRSGSAGSDVDPRHRPRTTVSRSTTSRSRPGSTR